MIRDWLRGVLALACAASLGSCGLFNHPAQPDELVKWAGEHGALLTPEPSGGQDLEGSRLTQTEDKHGYLLTPLEKGNGGGLRVYYVPVNEVDADLDAKLRKAVFPSGIASLAPPEEGAQPLRFAESELDGFYLRMRIYARSALCDDFKRVCDGVGEIALVGKLRGAPLLGKGRKLIKIDPLALAKERLIDKQLEDPAKMCGFDPEVDRVPTHIAASCQRLLLFDWAISHGYTINASDQPLPLTPETLKATMRALPDTFYLNRQLIGEVEKEQ